MEIPFRVRILFQDHLRSPDRRQVALFMPVTFNSGDLNLCFILQGELPICKSAIKFIGKEG